MVGAAETAERRENTEGVDAEVEDWKPMAALDDENAEIEDECDDDDGREKPNAGVEVLVNPETLD